MSRNAGIGILSLALLLVLSSACFAMTVAVGDFNTRGASYSVGRSVVEMLSSRLAGNRGFVMVERGQLDAVAKQQRISLSGMVSREDAVSIGRIVGAKYYIQGAVSHFGVLTLLTARLMDVERGTVVAAYQSMTSEGEKGVPLAVRTLAADILSSLTGPEPTGTAVEDYKNYLYEALGYYNQGDYARSLRFWDRMVQMSPKNATLRFIVAAMHYSRGRYGEAELSAKEATAFDPSFAEAHLLAGKSLFMRGRDYEATGPLGEAIRLKPDMAEPYFLMGQAYKNRGRLEEAMEYLSMAIEKDPNHSGAYVALGQMFLEVAQLDLARQALSRAVELNGTDGGARFLLGTTLALAGDDEGARAQVKKLRSLDPSLAEKLAELLK